METPKVMTLEVMMTDVMHLWILVLIAIPITASAYFVPQMIV
ncbi:MAG: hypothetical protein ACHQYP_08750 [Nitrospiria bacterium]